MSTVIRDLWPEDINSEEILTPEEILQHQAQRLEERTNGVLVGHVVRLAGEDRVVLGFEVEAPRAGNRVRLFEAQHRLEFEYPVSIDPPDVDMPTYLKERVYQSGSILAEVQLPFRPGKWVDNESLASSPNEFTQKVEEILARPAVKAIVLSLIARSTRDNSATNQKPEGP